MHEQIIYLKVPGLYMNLRKHKQAKKERHCAGKNIAREYQGWNSNPRPLTSDAKRTGLDDLHESVRLDVMDLPDGRKFKYLNASHQIGVGGLCISL